MYNTCIRGVAFLDASTTQPGDGDPHGCLLDRNSRTCCARCIGRYLYVLTEALHGASRPRAPHRHCRAGRTATLPARLTSVVQLEALLRSLEALCTQFGEAAVIELAIDSSLEN